MRAIHTNDYPRQTIKDRKVWMPMVTAIATGVGVFIVLRLLTDGDSNFVPGGELLIACIMASLYFSIGYYYGRRPHEYFLASIPITGIARVLFFIFAWVLWVPLLISFVRMRIVREEQEELDQQMQRSLDKEWKLHLTADTETYFPQNLREKLADYCLRRAESSSALGISLSEDEAKEIVERIIGFREVMELQNNPFGNPSIIIRARRQQFSYTYDLGNYCLELYDTGEFGFYQVRTGRLFNERPLEDSLDTEMELYIDERSGHIQMEIFAGRVDMAVARLIDMMNGGNYLFPYLPYHMDEHYHLAQEIYLSESDNPPA